MDTKYNVNFDNKNNAGKMIEIELYDYDIETIIMFLDNKIKADEISLKSLDLTDYNDKGYYDYSMSRIIHDISVKNSLIKVLSGGF